jgi:hypothetical protein
MAHNLEPAVDVLAAERRRGPDRRRRHPLLGDWTWGFRGRRRGLRRDGDRRGASAIIDHFGAPLLLLAIAIFVLSACDAVFTLTLIEHGLVTEANPVMKTLLANGVGAFVAGKVALTGIGVVTLVAYSEMRFLGRFPLGQSLSWIAGFYAILIAYEVMLLEMI